MKKVIDRGKRIKSEWSKASQKHKSESVGFSRDNPVQNEVLPSHTLQNHVYV